MANASVLARTELSKSADLSGPSLGCDIKTLSLRLDGKKRKGAKLVTEATRKFFYLVVVILIASALGSQQSANSTPTQDSAAQTASAKARKATAPPNVNADASGVIFFQRIKCHNRSPKAQRFITVIPSETIA
jgi:hypothetical protein